MRSATPPYDTVLETLRPTLEKAKTMLGPDEKEDLIDAIKFLSDEEEDLIDEIEFLLDEDKYLNL